ncbi:MAG: hypothetical protein NVS3B5_11530 [Sphingomicrobium sp.]
MRDVRRSQRHRSAKAVTDKRDLWANAADEWNQDMFDMASEVDVGARAGFAPVNQQDAMLTRKG